MSATARRKKLLNKLQESKTPIIGSDLADSFNVSRQVIVQDIALLRAKGEEILATSKGYLISEVDNQMVEGVIACKHGVDDNGVQEELATIINYGGRIKDVVVEHPMYGELKGRLVLQSQSDLEDFMKRYRAQEVKPLSALTDGIHLHTVEALNREVLNLIKEKLNEKGYLLEDY
jgi:transcriptional regulator of NAD metabolism